MSLFPSSTPRYTPWTPPGGKFSAVNHYIDLCRLAVRELAFKAKTKNSNLSPTEGTALLQLSKRSDIVIKPADEGGAIVVLAPPLYIAEANSQLSDVRLYERLDHDPIKENQYLVKTR